MRTLLFQFVLTITLVLTVMEVAFFTGFVQAATTMVIIQPDSNEPQNIAELSVNNEEDYISRVGQVMFTAKEQFFPQPPEEDESVARSFMHSELVMSFFSDQEFRIIIDYSSSGRGVRSLGGRMNYAAFSTFSMTVTNETYLITFQDVDNGMTYKVVGDMETGIGRVTEYDLTKLPPVYDGPPIIPPSE